MLDIDLSPWAKLSPPTGRDYDDCGHHNSSFSYCDHNWDELTIGVGIFLNQF